MTTQDGADGGRGGYGDPLEQDPELILDDVLGRKVSAEAARVEYGIVVDEKGLRVDAEATPRVRAELHILVPSPGPPTH